MRPTLLLATTLTVLSVVQTACGSSDDGAADPTTAPTVPATDPTDPQPVPSTTPPGDRPTATNDIVVDDGSFGSIAEMGGEADLVVVGDVVDVSSIGRPDLATNPDAGEYVAITVRTVDALRGEGADEIVLAWNAYDVGADGERVATRVYNGVRPPEVGDRLLVFTDPVDAAFDAHVGGAPTHQLVKLDGIAFVDGDRLVGGEVGSPVAELLAATSLDAVREALAA